MEADGEIYGAIYGNIYPTIHGTINGTINNNNPSGRIAFKTGRINRQPSIYH